MTYDPAATEQTAAAAPLAIVRKSDLARYLAEDPGTPASELKVGDHLLVTEGAKPGGPFVGFIAIAQIWQIEPAEDGRLAIGVYTTGLGGAAWTHVCEPTQLLHACDPQWTLLVRNDGAGTDAAERATTPNPSAQEQT